MSKKLLLAVLLVLGIGGADLVWGQEWPAEEISIQNDVDHWGLAFSDQLAQFQGWFADCGEDETFVLGVESSLRKTFRNKYWFKGDITDSVSLYAARNESEAFQLAVIPNMGVALNNVVVTASELVSCEGGAQILAEAVRLYRVGFVETAQPQYPCMHVGYWPDPLDELDAFSLDGLDLGLVWYEVKVPADALPGDYTGEITVTADGAATQTLTVNLHVWDFALPDRVDIATMVWIAGDMAATDYYQELCGLFLEHHLDPISVGDTMDFDVLDANLEFCMARGLRRFQTPGFGDPETFRAYYEHIRERGWLDEALIYGAHDEPTLEQLRDIVIPKTEEVHREFPGLNVFLASQYYDELDQGTDIWLADLSTNYNSWLNAGRPGEQENWWYFCGIPIGVGMERPIAEAPRMLIDRDAVEHRIVYWMGQHYGTQGFLIWAGNRAWTSSEQLTRAKLTYPYGGIHNGDGFLVYPGLRPSVRLKNVRDGIEDYWYLNQLAELADAGGELGGQAQELLDGIVPSIFVDTHYFNRDPQVILDYRLCVGEFLERSLGQ